MSGYQMQQLCSSPFTRQDFDDLITNRIPQFKLTHYKKKHDDDRKTETSFRKNLTNINRKRIFLKDYSSIPYGFKRFKKSDVM